MINYKKIKHVLCKSLILTSVMSFFILGTIESQAQEKESLDVQKTVVFLKLGQVENINYNSAEEDNDIKYYSDDLKVASVDGSGNIIGNMIGSTTITGEQSDGDRLKTVVIVYRDILEPLTKIKEPRFTLKNGVYKNKSAKKTDEALLMFTGDLMNQTRQQLAAKTEDGTYIYNDSFSLVKNIFAKADFVTGNLESLLSNTSPYMSEEKELGGQPHCNGPSTYLDAVRYAGFDALVTANNHMTDNGERGLVQTLDEIDEYKFAHTGTFRDDKEQRFIIVDVNGIKIALMAYSEKFNGKDITIDEDKRETMLNRFTKEAVEKDVKDAKAKGAEYIIAYNHWGVEYTNDYNEDQAKSAKIMADAGVDFILGSHPHALQTYDVITASDNRQVPIIYSLGNFVSHQYKTVSKDTFILALNLKRDANGKVYLANKGYIPCHVFEKCNGISYLVTPVSTEFNNGIVDLELNAADSRIKTILNNGIPQIKSYEEINNLK